MKRASRSGRPLTPTRPALPLVAPLVALLVALPVALTACGGSSGGPSTTIVGGAPLHLPDDAALQRTFGPDARIARTKPVRGGKIDRACGRGTIALRERNGFGVQGKAPTGAQVTVNSVVLDFPSAGLASSYFTSFARGKTDCEWTDVNRQKRRLAEASPLDDVGGARLLDITVIHDAATGASSTNTLVLRSATVAEIVATPPGVAADAVNKVASLLTG